MRTDTPSSLAASAVRIRGRGSASGAKPPGRPGGPRCPPQTAPLSRRGEQAGRAPAESAAVRAQATASDANDRSRRTGSPPRTRPASGSTKAGRVRTNGCSFRAFWRRRPRAARAPAGPGTSAGCRTSWLLRSRSRRQAGAVPHPSPARGRHQRARTGGAPGRDPFPRATARRPSARPVIKAASGGLMGTEAIGSASREGRARSGSPLGGDPGRAPVRPQHAGPARANRGKVGTPAPTCTGGGGG